MVTKNTGETSQDEFEAILAPYGKDVFVHRITDTAEVRGRCGRGVTKAQPADYIVTERGVMYYAEAKSTLDPRRFRLSAIRTGQMAAARRQVAAGGQYFFFLHSRHHRAWYKVPAAVFLTAPAASLTWEELAPYRWDLANDR